MDAETELRGRVAMLEKAEGENNAGLIAAIKTVALTLARLTDTDPAGIIAALDAEAARFLAPQRQQALMVTAVADLLRMATQPRA